MAALTAAVKMGADAVYLGLTSYSARASAVNFTPESLKEAVFYCRKRGVEAYITLNTLVYDNEISKIKKLIEIINGSLADGVIVQDFGVFDMVKKLAPELKTVASTQMTANNLAGVKLLENIGFDAVVLPRELSASDIAGIRRGTGIELEVFAHGALCVCYSGQCLMSSFIGERSGNRGKCAQPCRMFYETPHKKGYFLSTRDLSLVSRLRELEGAGVDTVKIEGRLKNEYYTAAVTDIYRRVSDSGEPPTAEDYADIEAAFLRGGYTTGYFDGISGKGLFNFSKNENPYTRETQKLEKRYKRILSENSEFSKVSASVELYIEKGKNVEVNLYFAEREYGFQSQTVAQEALSAPLTAEKISARLDKTGNETFCFEEIEINLAGGDIFLSAADINRIRREIGAFIDEILQAPREKAPSSFSYFSYNMRKRAVTGELGFFCTVRTALQIKWIKEKWEVKIFAPQSAIEDYKAKEYGDLTNVGLICARIASDKDMAKTARFLEQNSAVSDILVGNIGYFNDLFVGKYNIYADFSLNVTNTLSAGFYEKQGVCDITASVEANIKNIKNIMTGNIPLSVVGYGKIPLMITESCLKSNISGKCQKEQAPYRQKTFTLKDQKGEEFIIECEDGCRNSVYNPYPIMMADKLKDIKAAGVNRVCLKFFDENKAQVEEIILSFKSGQNPLTKFTRGHFYRGAY
jgi:putative protease